MKELIAIAIKNNTKELHDKLSHLGLKRLNWTTDEIPEKHTVVNLVEKCYWTNGSTDSCYVEHKYGFIASNEDELFVIIQTNISSTWAAKALKQSFPIKDMLSAAILQKRKPYSLRKGVINTQRFLSSGISDTINISPSL